MLTVIWYLFVNVLLWLEAHIEANVNVNCLKPYYIAGVVEFPVWMPHLDPIDDRQMRLAEFRELLLNTISEDIRPDIVVFPEHVLNNYTTAVRIPKPQMGYVACGSSNYDYDYDNIIRIVSCLAQQLRIYLLIHLNEQTPTTNGVGTIYSTNVVFDRNGSIISRYRKFQLIDEGAIFSTDFNVTFAHVSTLDLRRFSAAQMRVNQHITDFIYTNNLPSQLSFHTAMQLHQSWAYANNVNLLVAGFNDAKQGFTGTGIYAGKYGALNASMSTSLQQSQIYMSLVPKKDCNFSFESKVKLRQSIMQKKSRLTGVRLTRDSNIDKYTAIPLSWLLGDNISTFDTQNQVCHSDLCCNFHILGRHIKSANKIALNGVTSSYHYRLAAYKAANDVALCALLACIDTDLHSCGRIFPEEVAVHHRFVFESIVISGNFSYRTPHLLISMPSSVDGMLAPLPVECFDWQVHAQQNSQVYLLNYTLLQAKSDLLTFGVYVNFYLPDVQLQHYNYSNGNQSIHINLVKSLLAMLFTIYYIKSFILK